MSATAWRSRPTSPSFTQNGKAYLPFPDPRTFRIKLKDLADEAVRERLRLIWTQPSKLDPGKVSAEVTREIAGYLAELAKSLEKQGHDPEVVAQFLTRCLFCMFAEDVGLLPEHGFSTLLKEVPEDGTGFTDLLGTLFREMNTGTGKSISVILRKKLLRFSGGLFADHTVLPVNGLQLGLLKQAHSGEMYDFTTGTTSRQDCTPGQLIESIKPWNASLTPKFSPPRHPQSPACRGGETRHHPLTPPRVSDRRPQDRTPRHPRTHRWQGQASQSQSQSQSQTRQAQHRQNTPAHIPRRPHPRHRTSTPRSQRACHSRATHGSILPCQTGCVPRNLG